MEHTEMDELFKKAVREKEGSASLERGKANALWNKVQDKEISNRNLYWKVACILLLFCSLGLSYSIINSNSKMDQLNRKLLAVKDSLMLNESNPQRKNEVIVQTQHAVKPEKEIVIKKVTSYKYVEKEKLVYKEIKIPSVNREELDSLNREIAIRDQRIAELNEIIVSDSGNMENKRLTTYPLQVAFQQKKPTIETPSEKDGKIKFQVSLFNLH